MINYGKVLSYVLMLAIGFMVRGWYDATKEVKDVKQEIKQAKVIQSNVDKVEAKAAEVKVITETKFKTIYRDRVKYVQNPNRTICDFDDESIRMRQQAVDAANAISGLDGRAVQGK